MRVGGREGGEGEWEGGRVGGREEGREGGRVGGGKEGGREICNLVKERGEMGVVREREWEGESRREMNEII